MIEFINVNLKIQRKWPICLTSFAGVAVAPVSAFGVGFASRCVLYGSRFNMINGNGICTATMSDCICHGSWRHWMDMSVSSYIAGKECKCLLVSVSKCGETACLRHDTNYIRCKIEMWDELCCRKSECKSCFVL